jgi:iron(III) transport system ATP-binding protein
MTGKKELTLKKIKDLSNDNKKIELELKNLVKTFHDGRGKVVRAVDNISLTIYRGEFITLLGPSGCGKTTTLRIIAGFEHPDSGEVLLGKKDIINMPAFERNMPMVFQSYALFPHLNIFENIAYGLKIKKISKSIIQNDVEMALQLLNLVGLENRYPGELSGGQQQRVALARAIVLKPQIILFDEPLSNLDAKLRIQTRMEIKRLQNMLGITTVYVTHDQSEALSLSDKIILMNKGKIEQMGTPEEIYNKPKSLFVTDFIGNANIFDSSVDDIRKNDVLVNLYDSTLSIPKENLESGIKKGEEVYLAIKPEAIKISKASTGFSGKVFTQSFLGASKEFEVEFGNSLIKIIKANTGTEEINVKTGDNVNISFNTSFFRVLKKD